jgi:hypothetical protein
MAFDKVIDSSVLNTKLLNIANAIRKGTRQNKPIADVDMPFATSEIDTSGYGKLPAYWNNAVNNAISTIKGLQGDPNNIPLFAYFSDCHIRPNATTPNPGNTGILAAMVMNACQIPFAMCCGDSARSDGNGLTSENQMVDCFDTANRSFAPIGWHRLLQTQGNHDGSWGTANGKAYAYQMSPSQLYDYIYRKQETTGNHVFGGGDNSYFYVDDTENKIRIIMLNSCWCETSNNSDGTAVYSRQHYWGYGQAQLNWLANTALNVDSGWVIFIGTHIPPLDIDVSGTLKEYTKNTRDVTLLNGILSAYENKTSYSGSYTKNTSRGEGDWANVSVSVNFANALGKIVGFYCGHCHIDKVINDTLPFPIVTITSDGDISYDDAEPDRLMGTANEHALDFVTINKVTQSVTLTRLGVGASRAYSYKGIVLYSITNALTNVSTNNSSGSVEEESNYTATLTVNDGYENLKVTVTMGGVDITSTVYSNGVVTIPVVTGNIVITASATEILPYTNQIPLSTDKDGSIYNDIGYKIGYRINSSAEAVEYSTSPVVAATGFIPCEAGDIIRLKNCYIDMSHKNAASLQVKWYDSNKVAVNGTPWTGFTSAYNYITDENNHIVQFTNWNGSETSDTGIAYVRLTIVPTSDDPIVTINEDFDGNEDFNGNEDIKYTITNNLTNVSNNNSASSISNNSAYTATLTVISGYELHDVTVIMGGVDITSSSYNNGTINISNVTGDIIITAIAVISTPNVGYTNLADPSADGWVNNSRLSSSGTDKGEGGYSGGVVTNFIECKRGDVIRIKGINLTSKTDSSNTTAPYVQVYYENNKMDCADINSYESAFIESGGVTTFNVFCLTNTTTQTGTTNGDVNRIRFSGKLTAASANDIVITKNEEIT